MLPQRGRSVGVEVGVEQRDDSALNYNEFGVRDWQNELRTR